jgi:predicted anti-sigma-YlaC factor YlaD
MNVSREVIVDLLPLYLADEASPETQALVEEHLERDAELAQLARQWKERLPTPAPAVVNPDAQAVAWAEARRQLWNRFFLLAGAIAVGVLVIAGGGLIGAMLLLAR